MQIRICLLLLSLSFVAQAQRLSIIPAPALTIIPSEEHFILNKKTTIVLGHGSGLERFSGFLNSYLDVNYGFHLPVQKFSAKSATTNIIQIGYLPLPDSSDKKSSYHLTVKKNMISVSSRYNDGLFYGIQSLLQLLYPQQAKSFSIQTLTIYDYPRFDYRGMHLDVARHFFPVAVVKRYIDYLAYHKLNYFHWHLTDDQGWRIEIKKYPKLTSIGGWRNGTIIGRYPGTGNDGIKYGGFYTQEQIKEVVKYAAERYITVVPEIEMPGHASAAIAAYPELSCFPTEPTINYYPKQCKWNGPMDGKQVQQTWGVFDDVFCAGKENTFKFMEDVLDEILPLFPSKYIHVGGDECPKTNWKKCPDCQKRIADNKLKNEHELQSYFIQRMEKYLNSKGRVLIGWDEILEGGLAPNAMVMSWRGEQGGIDAAKQGHNVIMTPGSPLYFDHSQSENEDSVTIGGYNPTEKVYAYEPIPKELNKEQSKHILGAQANLWTEYIGNEKKLEYMLFPRLSALSEVLWSQKGNKDWDDFQKRLIIQFKKYDLWKANYSKAYYDLSISVQPSINHPGGIMWSLKPRKGTIAVYEIKEIYVTPTADTVPMYDVKDPSKLIGWKIEKQGDTVVRNFRQDTKTSFFENINIPASGFYEVKAYNATIRDFEQLNVESRPFTTIQQSFLFNKATGKKITLTKEASKKYPGDGAFTLVNGVTNEKGLQKSKEFLGFEGEDCEAIIDLGEETNIKEIRVHTLTQTSSWIYPPKQGITVMLSDDGIHFTVPEDEVGTVEPTGGVSKIWFSFSHAAVKTRYIKVIINNYGIIPPGNPGAGNKAWLFVDEIEVQ